MPNAPHLLTEFAAARWLGLSPTTLRAMRRAGTGPTWYDLRREPSTRAVVRYPLTGLQDWLEAREVKP
jgi:hypothetical protein